MDGNTAVHFYCSLSFFSTIFLQHCLFLLYTMLYGYRYFHSQKKTFEAGI